jgi:hypothetical protein
VRGFANLCVEYIILFSSFRCCFFGDGDLSHGRGLGRCTVMGVTPVMTCVSIGGPSGFIFSRSLWAGVCIASAQSFALSITRVLPLATLLVW